MHFAPALFVLEEMCCTLTGVTAKRIRRRVTLTYAAVWPGETRCALTTVPVFTIHTCPTVVATERERRKVRHSLVQASLQHYKQGPKTALVKHHRRVKAGILTYCIRAVG